MDLTNVALGLSEVCETRFEDTLLKRIKNDFYYVLDFSQDVSGLWGCRPMRVESNRYDVPNRIRLYDQPSASKLGVSFSVNSFIGIDRVVKIVDTLIDLNVPVEGLKEQLLALKAGDVDSAWYPDTEARMLELWDGIIKMRTGYMTVSVEGKYVVDREGYDVYMVNRLYDTMRLNEVGSCYVCGSSEDLIHGGTKEPAWKFLSTTRTTDVSSSGIAYVRCMSCERRLMRGFYEMQSLVKVEHTKAQTFERLVIPLTRDVKLWRQLKRLRSELSSDMRYYEALEGLLDRFERRGVTEVLYARILKNKRSYAVLSCEVLKVSDMRHLRKREVFVRLLRDGGYMGDREELVYFPEELLASDSSYRWKIVDRMKRYWMGLEGDVVIDDMERLLKVPRGRYSVLRMWGLFLETGERFLDMIEGTYAYGVGKLFGYAVRVQERERGVYDALGYTGRTSIERRFNGYPRDLRRAYDEFVKVIDYRSLYLTESEYAGYVDCKRYVKDLMDVVDKDLDGRLCYEMGVLRSRNRLV